MKNSLPKPENVDNIKIYMSKTQDDLIDRIEVVDNVGYKWSVPSGVKSFLKNFLDTLELAMQVIGERTLQEFVCVHDARENSITFYNKQKMNQMVAINIPSALGIISFDDWCTSAIEGDNEHQSYDIDKEDMSITFHYNDSDDGDDDAWESDTIFYFDFI